MIRELETARRHARVFENHIRHLEREITALHEIRQRQAGELRALQGSTFWKMTAPARALVLLLRGQMTPRQIGEHVGFLQPRAPMPEPLVQPLEGPADLAPLSFPLPGRIATPMELTEAAPVTLPVTVSVVIPTFNAGREFHWLIRKLKAQKGLARVEVVVVDSGSSDGTDKIAEAAGCVVVRIPNSDFDHSYARNLGADTATGDLLLFTVQDAYPAGDGWLHSLAKALMHPATEAERVSAISCSEFPRKDSEFFYNAGIDIHYRFLGCRDKDRLGVLKDQDQTSVRTQGQLSDVACMIPAATFQQYRYQGRYAEDLLLGVRMIRDGHRLGLLSSVQVIHSHNRSAAYHLKRTFVDVVFLQENFPDFVYPFTDTLSGALWSAVALEPMVRDWAPKVGEDAGQSLRKLAAKVRRNPLHVDKVPPGTDFGFPPLADWIPRAIAAENRPGPPEAEPMRAMLADRLGELAGYAERMAGAVDDHLAREIGTGVRKAFASVVGAQLCFLYLSYAHTAPAPLRKELQALREMMLAGV